LGKEGRGLEAMREQAGMALYRVESIVSEDSFSLGLL